MLTRWDYRIPDFWGEFGRLNREISRLFDASSTSRKNAGVFPPLNIFDDGDNLVVRAEVPGIAPEQLEINATGKSLSIKGERRAESVDSGAYYHRRERGHGTFSRAITLPQEIDPDKVKAGYKLGVLEIVLPKAEATKPRRIQINA